MLRFDSVALGANKGSWAGGSVVVVHEFWIWLFLLLLAPVAGIWGLVSAKRRERRERDEDGRPSH